MTKKQKNETLQDTAEPVVEETIETPEQPDALAVLEADIARWKELAMRSQADMENLRKRTQHDIESAHKYANGSFAKDLLPVADYLAGAIDCAQKEIDKQTAAGATPDVFMQNLLKGVEMTQKQLDTVFRQHGIEKMETTGLVFDPNLHKVIQEIDNPELEPGTIVQELQSGYTIGKDRVLREAMVVVSK